MPLQLSNLGPYPLRIGPYFSICQLMLIRLHGAPTRTYGDADLRSKYVNDDGGPSLWWRDARVEQLQTRLGQTNALEAIRQEIVEKVRFESTEVIARFQRDIDRERVGRIENADQVLERFARRENRRRMVDRFFIGLPALFAAAWLASAFALFDVEWFVLLGFMVISLVPAVLAYERHDDGYLGTRELRTRVPPGKTA